MYGGIQDTVAATIHAEQGENNKPKVIEMIISVDYKENIYRRGDSGYYDVGKAVINMETSYVRGFGPTRDGTTQKAVQEKMPNTEAGEFMRAKIIERNNRYYLVSESGYLLGDYLWKSSYEAEVTFTKGTWEDFRTGKDVDMEYTDSGLATLKKEMERQFSTELSAPIIANYREQLRKAVAKKFGVPDQEVTSEDIDEVFSISVDVKVEVLNMPRRGVQANMESLSFWQEQPIATKSVISILITEK